MQPTSPASSGKPLTPRLGVRPGQTLAVLDPPDNYRLLAEPLPDGAQLIDGPDPQAEVLHLFARDRADLAGKLGPALARRPDGGMVWVSWPWTGAGQDGGLTEDQVREAVQPAGWVGVKRCADREWSGLKFLRRKA